MRVTSLAFLTFIIALSYGQATDIHRSSNLNIERESLHKTEGIAPVVNVPPATDARTGSRQSSHNHRVVQGASLALLGTILTSIVLMVWHCGGGSSNTAARDQELPPLREIQVNVEKLSDCAEVRGALPVYLRPESGGSAGKQSGDERGGSVGEALKSVSEPLRIARPISEITVIRRSTGDAVGLQTSDSCRKHRRKCFTCY